MRTTPMRWFLLLTVAACWFACDVNANNIDAPQALSITTDTDTTNVERHRRIKAPDGEDRLSAQQQGNDRVLVVNGGASATTALKASTATAPKTSDVPSSGPAPAIVLITGSVVIAVVALAFQRRRVHTNERDENDPMQQSLLFHDMDYAAM